MKLRILEIVRKLLVLFAVIAGVFTFQGAITATLPKEKVRIELLVGAEDQKEEQQEVFILFSSKTFSIESPLPKPQILRPLFLTLLISSQQHHSSL